MIKIKKSHKSNDRLFISASGCKPLCLLPLYDAFPKDGCHSFFQLTKQTTVQATGVASNLVEIIQGSGFKLQTLNLSFEDEEDTVTV